MRRLLSWVLVASIWPLSTHAQVSDPAMVIPSSRLRAPPAGGTVTDPAFGVTLRRLTNRGENGGLATAEYPQLQAVNADETRVLVSTETDYRIMDIASGQETHVGINLSMPRWHPVEADVLIGFNRRSGNIQFQHLELMGGGVFMTQNIVNISALGFSDLTLGSWEDASSDGRYIPIHNQSGGGDQAAVIDTVTGQVAVRVNTGGVDWVGVSPSGQYMAVQHGSRGTGNTNGLVIYDVATGNLLGHATDHGEHGDLGVDAQGNDVFGTVAWTDLCADGEAPCFSVSPLPDAVESNRLQNRRVFDPPVGNYTSCRAVRRGGFCLSSDDYGRPGGAPFRGELWLNRMSDGEVLRLAHHRSSANSYYTLVRPSLSPTGRYALYTSDWARPNGANQGDLYVIDLSPFIDNWIASPASMDAGVIDSGPASSADAGFEDVASPVDGGTSSPPPDGGSMNSDAGGADGGLASDAGVTSSDSGISGVQSGGTSGGCTGVAGSSGGALIVLMSWIGIIRRRR